MGKRKSAPMAPSRAATGPKRKTGLALTGWTQTLGQSRRRAAYSCQGGGPWRRVSLAFNHFRLPVKSGARRSKNTLIGAPPPGR